jgi:hypothetical protein
LGCEGVRPPTKQEILEIFPRPMSQQGTSAGIKAIEIYIDASIPVQNFVRLTANQPKTSYSRLLEFMGANPWNADVVKLYGFGEGTPKPIESPTARGLTIPATDRSFYDQRTSHVGELIAEFVRDTDRQRREGTVKLIVTDFVQANKPSGREPSTSNWPYVANQIREFRKRFGGWQLLALRSAYCGRHFAEADKVNFVVDPPVDRPYYILAFAPTEQMAEEAVNYLLEGSDVGDWKTSARRFNPERLMGRVKWINKSVPAQFGANSERRNMASSQSDLYKSAVLELNWNSISDPMSEAFVIMDLAFEVDDPNESFIDLNRLSTSPKLTLFDWLGDSVLGDSARYRLRDSKLSQYDFRLTPAPADSFPS